MKDSIAVMAQSITKRDILRAATLAGLTVTQIECLLSHLNFDGHVSFDYLKEEQP